MPLYICVFSTEFFEYNTDINYRVKCYYNYESIGLTRMRYNTQHSRYVFITKHGILSIMMNSGDVWKLPKDTKYIIHLFCDDIDTYVQHITFPYEQQYDNIMIYFDSKVSYNDAINKIKNDNVYNKFNVCCYYIYYDKLVLTYTKCCNE